MKDTILFIGRCFPVILLAVSLYTGWNYMLQRDAAETALRDCHAERIELYRTLAEYAPDPYKELVDSLTSGE